MKNPTIIKRLAAILSAFSIAAAALPAFAASSTGADKFLEQNAENWIAPKLPDRWAMWPNGVTGMNDSYYEIVEGRTGAGLHISIPERLSTNAYVSFCPVASGVQLKANTKYTASVWFKIVNPEATILDFTKIGWGDNRYDTFITANNIIETVDGWHHVIMEYTPTVDETKFFSIATQGIIDIIFDDYSIKDENGTELTPNGDMNNVSWVAPKIEYNADYSFEPRKSWIKDWFYYRQGVNDAYVQLTTDYAHSGDAAIFIKQTTPDAGNAYATFHNDVKQVLEPGVYEFEYYGIGQAGIRDAMVAAQENGAWVLWKYQNGASIPESGVTDGIWKKYSRRINITEELTNFGWGFFMQSPKAGAVIDDVAMYRLDADGNRVSGNLIKNGSFEDYELPGVNNLMAYSAYWNDKVVASWNNPTGNDCDAIDLYADGEKVNVQFNLAAGAFNKTVLSDLNANSTITLYVTKGGKTKSYTASATPKGTNGTLAYHDWTYRYTDPWVDSTGLNNKFAMGAFLLDTNERYEGNASIKAVSNAQNGNIHFTGSVEYVRLSQSIVLEQDVTYKFSFMAKTKNAAHLQAIDGNEWNPKEVPIPANSDWTEYSYIIRGNGAANTIGFQLYRACEGIWIDNVSLYEYAEADDEIYGGNLINGGDFEYDELSIVPEFKANDKIITSIQPGEITASVNITNTGLKNANVSFIGAMYKDGALNNIFALTDALAPFDSTGTSNTITLSGTVDVPETDGYSIKVFVWDSEESQTPLLAAPGELK